MIGSVRSFNRLIDADGISTRSKQIWPKIPCGVKTLHDSQDAPQGFAHDSLLTRISDSPNPNLEATKLGAGQSNPIQVAMKKQVFQKWREEDNVLMF